MTEIPHASHSSHFPPAQDGSTEFLPPNQQSSDSTIDMEVKQPQISSHKLLGRIGYGGFGEVYRAVDLSFNREVALKIIKLGKSHEVENKRFMAEAIITGNLQHPNILPVHNMGKDQDGRCYFSMKLTNGITLSGIIDSLKGGSDTYKAFINIPHVLRVFLDVCNAVAYAHSKGVIHRDLKPDNVMIGDFGEVYVLDWGLAKTKKEKQNGIYSDNNTVECCQRDSDIGQGHTVDGTILGTPGYMPPEQAAGKLELIDERSDIYSLGAILFETVTLELPVDGKSNEEIIQKTIAGALRHPAHTKMQRQIPPEISAIILKCLEQSPDNRYQSVNQLTKDIQNFLQDRQTSALPDNYQRKLWKWIRRNRSLSASIISGIIIGGFSLSLLLATLLYSAAKEARAEKKERETTTKLLKLEREDKQRILSQTEATRYFDLAQSMASRAMSFDKAESLYTKAIKAYPDFRRAYRERAITRIRLGKLLPAIADLEEENNIAIRTTGKENEETLCMLGQIYRDYYKDTMKAVEYYKRAAISGNRTPQSEIGNINALELEGRLSDAISALKLLCEKYPNMYEVHYKLASLLYEDQLTIESRGQKLVRLGRAAKAAEQASLILPTSIEALFLSAQVNVGLLELTGDELYKKKAGIALSRVLGISPDNIKAIELAKRLTQFAD